jgi:hypothetical protein
LNDQYTFRTNQSSSLWDAQYQCKPAFFAVVEVGINYNALDSLISASDSLQASEYTTDSWANFAAALTAAQAAMAEDYSASVSAAEALGEARHTLQAAVEGLVKIVTGVETPDNGSPKSFVLGQNYPNPFNPATWINYSVPQNGYISLKVYNLLGEEVATLFEGSQLAGNYVVSFDGTQLVNGVYLYQLKANNYKETKKLTLLK